MDKADIKGIIEKCRSVDVTPLPTLFITIEEAYTPRDWLAQRYRVMVRKGSSVGGVLAWENEVLDVKTLVQRWQRSFGVRGDNIVFVEPKS